MPKLKFEKLDVGSTISARVGRAKIPGGWLLIAISNSGVDSPSIPTRSTSGTGTRSRTKLQRLLLPRLGPVDRSSGSAMIRILPVE